MVIEWLCLESHSTDTSTKVQVPAQSAICMESGVSSIINFSFTQEHYTHTFTHIVGNTLPVQL